MWPFSSTIDSSLLEGIVIGATDSLNKKIDWVARSLSVWRGWLVGKLLKRPRYKSVVPHIISLIIVLFITAIVILSTEYANRI